METLLQSESSIHVLTFFTMSMINFSIAYVFYVTVRNFVRNADKTDATVLSTTNASGRAFFNISPITLTVSFEDSTGKEVVAATLADKSTYLPGDKVEIYYSKDNPHLVKLNRLLFTWLKPIVIFVSGILFLVISILNIFLG